MLLVEWNQIEASCKEFMSCTPYHQLIVGSLLATSVFKLLASIDLSVPSPKESHFFVRVCLNNSRFLVLFNEYGSRWGMNQFWNNKLFMVISNTCFFLYFENLLWFWPITFNIITVLLKVYSKWFMCFQADIMKVEFRWYFKFLMG